MGPHEFLLVAAAAILGFVVGFILGLPPAGASAIPALLGGFSTALGLILAFLFQDSYNRPRLILDGDKPIWVPKDIPMGREGEDRVSREVLFKVTRIRIRNAGRTAAKNCRATLDLPDARWEEKVSWYLPESRSVLTINAHDAEYVDVCASSIDEKTKIAPTEQGLKDHVRDAWVLPNLPQNGILRITAENASRLEVPIRLLDKLDGQGAMVEIRQQ